MRIRCWCADDLNEWDGLDGILRLDGDDLITVSIEVVLANVGLCGDDGMIFVFVL